MKRRLLVGLFSAAIPFALMAGAMFLCNRAQAQFASGTQSKTQASAVTSEQLAALMLDASSLPGFVQRTPETDPSLPPNSESQTVLNWQVNQYIAGRPPSPRTGSISIISRTFLSQDGLYEFAIQIRLNDSAEAATAEVAEFCQNVQAAYTVGTFTGATQIGDESRVTDTFEPAMLFRAGKLVVWLHGAASYNASHNGSGNTKFPLAALESASYQVLLQASQQPGLTGVTASSAQVAVNGHALPKGSLLLGKQVYVPVQAFAQAMGLTSRWDTKTGALTLSGAGRKTVALTAGSTAASVGGASSAPLKTPVLKQSGQPVMTLEDFLTVTGGRVTERRGSAVQVKA